MLAALGVTYGTPESIEFATEVQKWLADAAYYSSCMLAKDRGAFPIYDSAAEVGHPFLDRIKSMNPTIERAMKKYGRRNIALLTIAPTGTTSLMTQTTSGIEPVFLPVYYRKRKISKDDPDAKIVFIDEVGDAYEEYPVFHHKFIEWYRVNYQPEQSYEEVFEFINTVSRTEIDELVKVSPYYKASSNDVDWVNKVKLQGEVQKYVDHSISVTVNLPKDTSEELVDEIYLTAWKSGCKGITIYRDGSRAGVMSSESVTATDQNTKMNERPSKLPCKLYQYTENGAPWLLIISEFKGKPVEIFADMLSKSVPVLSDIESAEMELIS